MKIQEVFSNNINDILEKVSFVCKSKNKYEVSNVASVFDIEASSFYENGEKRSIMYAWVFGINGRCIRGRTWKEFLEVINEVKRYYKTSITRRFIIYVHNLSYEFQFIKDLFTWDTVFSIDLRKPIYAVTTSGIEFRCSYLLSGLSLAKMGENLLKYKVKKMVGDLDYDLIRHSNTPLTDKEWGYILNDGLVVMAYIQEEIERLGSIKDIPLTKTGYVRNLCRNNCYKNGNRFQYNNMIHQLTMTKNDYDMLLNAFGGGFTHANARYVGKTNNNVSSFDFASSYPAVMVSEKFPMSKAYYHEIESADDLKKMLKIYCCLFEVTFYNIREKVKYEHYISKSKCYEIDGYILDNGRVVEANKLSMVVTEQDFYIIHQMYKWDYMEIGTFKYFYKDYLPKDIIMSVLNLYNDKTTLKGIEGKEAEYMISKAMLNSIYGMCVTNPCRDLITYKDKEWIVEKGDVIEALEEYNNSYSRFLYYPWGVWITAYARRNLFSGINEFKNDYIYSDTDSLKVINVDKHKNYLDNYNKEIQLKINRCLESHGIPIELSKPKNKKGVVKLMGIWDYEGTYKKFKTLGAKRYIYYDENNQLYITISGVNKSNGVEYLYWKYKDINSIFSNFNEDLCFPSNYDDGKNASGKLCHTYIDTYQSGIVIDYLGNSYNYEELSSVHLEATSYELSLDEQFKKYLLTVNDYMIK